MHDLGKINYDSYCETRGWRSVGGAALPQFEAQSDDLKRAWRVSAATVVQAAEENGQVEGSPMAFLIGAFCGGFVTFVVALILTRLFCLF